MNPDFVSSHRDQFLQELTEFLAIPSVSALPSHAADCRRAAVWLMDALQRLGCPVVNLIEGEGHPLVWAESPQVEGAPTLLIYGHYDVQPPDPLAEWNTPPFEPTVVGDQLFARGAADDKGQIFCLLKAYQAAAEGGSPPINVRFLFEGEEECGGHVITDFLRADPSRLDVDAVLVCDMAYYAPGWPAVYTALRGLCYAEIHVRTLQRDLHSGSYGGVAPNALETLARILSELKSEDGEIHLPGLYTEVKAPTGHELTAWRSLPFDRKEYLAHEVTGTALTGLRKFSVLERTWALPTFEVHGIRGGFTGDGAKTVIPATAMAKVSLRLVPDLTFDAVAKSLKAAVKEVSPPWADVETRILHGADPVEIDVTGPVFQVLDRAFLAKTGRAPVPVRAGGSIPVVTELARGGAPIVLTGIGLPDDGLHSPNEKLDLSQLWDGIEIFAHFFELLGATPAADAPPVDGEREG